MTNPTIQEALAKLDPGNADHWTSEGLPRLDTVRALVGNQQVSREQVTLAAPGFTRAAALQQQTAAAQAAPAAAPQPEAPATTESTPSAAPAAAQVAPPTVSAPAQQATPEVPNAAQVEGTEASETQEGPTEADLRERLAEEKHRLQEIDQWLFKGNEERKKQCDKVDALINELHKFDKSSQSDAIRGYLDRQRQMLQERAAQGGGQKQRSQLDQAMARRPGRGYTRPQVPIKG